MVFKQGKYGVRSGNTLKASNRRYRRKYQHQSLLIRNVQTDGDIDGVGDGNYLETDHVKTNQVPYSLNKKGRWSLPEILKASILEGENRTEGFGIQLVELHKLMKSSNCISVCSSTNLDAGSCRRSKIRKKGHGYIHVNSVLNNNRRNITRRKMRDKNRRSAPVETTPENIRTDSNHENPETNMVRYHVVYPCPADSAMAYTPSSIGYCTRKPFIYRGYHDGIGKQRNIRRTETLIRESISCMDTLLDDSEEDEEEPDNPDEEKFECRRQGTVRNLDALLLEELLTKAQSEKAQSNNVNRLMTRKCNGSRSDSETSFQNDHIVYEANTQSNAANITEASKQATCISIHKAPRTEHVSVILPVQQVAPRNLTQCYGNKYRECNCLPRKFIVDISEEVSNIDSFKSCYGCAVGRVNACVVFVHDADNEINNVRENVYNVSLNTNFNDIKQTVKIETMFDYMETSVAEVILRTVFFIETLTLDALAFENVPYTSIYKRNQIPSFLEETAKWKSHSYRPSNYYYFDSFVGETIPKADDDIPNITAGDGVPDAEDGDNTSDDGIPYACGGRPSSDDDLPDATVSVSGVGDGVNTVDDGIPDVADGVSNARGDNSDAAVCVSDVADAVSDARGDDNSDTVVSVSDIRDGVSNARGDHNSDADDDVPNAGSDGCYIVSQAEIVHESEIVDKSMPNNAYCGICYESLITRPGTALISCGHWFCDDCWVEHLETQVGLGAVTLPCPEYDCDKCVDSGTALTLLNMRDIIKFAEFCHDNNVQKETVTKWCPNVKCGSVIEVNSNETKMARCECGREVCFDCLGPPHWPADCKAVSKYYQKLKDSGDAELLPDEFTTPLVVNGKHCPFCKRFVEKNGGCASIVCICGNAFCWGCGKGIRTSRHDDYYDTDSCVKNGGYGGDTFKTKVKEIQYSRNTRGQRKWYNVALSQRLEKHPLKIEAMKSKVGSLSKRLQTYMLRQAYMKNPVDLNIDIPDRKFSREVDKIPLFLSNAIRLHIEMHRLVENTALVLDSDSLNKTSRGCLTNAITRLVKLSPIIYDLFMNGSTIPTGELLTKLQEVRVRSRQAIKGLVKTVNTSHL